MYQSNIQMPRNAQIEMFSKIQNENMRRTEHLVTKFWKVVCLTHSEIFNEGHVLVIRI